MPTPDETIAMWNAGLVSFKEARKMLGLGEPMIGDRFKPQTKPVTGTCQCGLSNENCIHPTCE